MATKWKQTSGAVPRSVIQVIPVDRENRMLVMHRADTDRIRSARNCWSFPSGMHEIGKHLMMEGSRELEEEYGLIMKDGAKIGHYENIAGDPPGPDVEQWHWVITLAVALVDDVTLAMNKEPDKHDAMRFPPFYFLQDQEFYQEFKFHKSFHEYMAAHGKRAVKAIENFLMETA